MTCSSVYVFDGSYNIDISMCITSSLIDASASITIPLYTVGGYDVKIPGFYAWEPSVALICGGWTCSTDDYYCSAWTCTGWTVPYCSNISCTTKSTSIPNGDCKGWTSTWLDLVPVCNEWSPTCIYWGCFAWSKTCNLKQCTEVWCGGDKTCLFWSDVIEYKFAWVPAWTVWIPPASAFDQITFKAGCKIPLIIGTQTYVNTKTTAPSEPVTSVTLTIDSFTVYLNISATDPSGLTFPLEFSVGSISYNTSSGDFLASIPLITYTGKIAGFSISIDSQINLCLGTTTWAQWASVLTIIDEVLNMSYSCALDCNIKDCTNTYSTSSYPPVTAIVDNNVNNSIYVTLTESSNYIKQSYQVTGGNITASDNIIVYDISGTAMTISKPMTIDANTELTFIYLASITGVTTTTTSGAIVVLSEYNSSITIGQTVTGTGILTSTTVTDVSNTTITLSAPASISANTVLTFKYFINAITSTAVTSSTTIQLAESYLNPSIKPGFDISGNGIAPGTTVAAMNASTNVLTISKAATLSEYTTLYLYEPIVPISYSLSDVINSTIITLGDKVNYTGTGVTSIIGLAVSGIGIEAGTLVSNYDGLYNLTISLPTTIAKNASLTFIKPITSTVSGTTMDSSSVTLSASNGYILKDQYVTGINDQSGNEISGITVANISGTALTISQPESIMDETVLTFTTLSTSFNAISKSISYTNVTIDTSYSTVDVSYTIITLDAYYSSIVEGLQVLCSGQITSTVTVVSATTDSSGNSEVTVSNAINLMTGSVITFSSSPKITATITIESPGASTPSGLVYLATKVTGIIPGWYISGTGISNTSTSQLTVTSISGTTLTMSQSIILPGGTVLTFTAPPSTS